MPIHSPGPRLGHSLVLKGAKARLKGKGKRSLAAGLMLTSMIDMFVILVIFLIQNFSASGEILFISKDISLPKAKQTSALDRAPVVAISPATVVLEGEKVENVPDLQTRQEEDVPELSRRLAELKEQARSMRPDAPFDPHIIVQAHEGIDFGVVRRVLLACAVEGYTDVRFAVLQTKK
jgi:biopolymer transport protein ExbD